LTFCGNCGANLSELFDKTIREYEGNIGLARRLTDDGRYDEAIRILEAILERGDSRLESYVQTAVELRTKWEIERVAEMARAEKWERQARELLSAGNLSDAHAVLQRIPVGLRKSEVNELYSDIESRLTEIQTLSGELREALAANRYDGLLPKVTRLLLLQPGNAKLMAMAEKLRQQEDEFQLENGGRLIGEARAMLRRHDYAAAADRLSGVMGSILTGELRRDFDLYNEICWMWRELRRYPYVTPALVAIAERFGKTCPKDSNAQSLFASIAQKRSENRNDPCITWPIWVKPRNSVIPNCEVIPWRGCWNHDAVDGNTNTNADASRFIIAYGLALQGLDLAVLNTDLKLNQRRTVYQFLSGKIGRSHRRDVWGIEIGNSAVKAVQLQLDESDEPIVSRCVLAPHTPRLDTVTEESARHDIMRASLRRLVDECEMETGQAVVGLTALKSIGRFFDIPKMKPKRRADAIAYEAKVQIPIPLEHISYDYHVWDDSHERMQNVALFAARREHVRQLVSLFDEGPLEIVAVQPTFAALFNAAHWTLLREVDATKTVAILNIGLDSSILVAGGKNRLRYRNVNFGTDRLVTILADRFKLARPTAARWLVSPHSVPWIYQIDQELSRPLKEFVVEIQRTIDTFQNDGLEVSRMFVTGGGSLQHSVLRHLICGE
jgi:type IV pilus assembly protein PilM